MLVRIASSFAVAALAACSNSSGDLPDARTSFVDDAGVAVDDAHVAIDATSHGAVDAVPSTPADAHSTATADAARATPDAAAAVDAGAAPVPDAAVADAPPAAVDAGIDATPAQPFCGDGIRQSGEECDDGNNVDGDGCSSTCTITLLPDCTHRWSFESAVGANSGNTSFEVSNAGPLLTGFNNGGADPIALAAADGSVLWTSTQGYCYTGNVLGTHGVIQECLGGFGTAFDFLDLTNGQLEGRASYSFDTGGWGTGPVAVGPDGSAMIWSGVSPRDSQGQPVTDWDVALGPTATELSGSGTQTVIIVDDAGGNYVNSLILDAAFSPYGKPQGLADGRWLFVTQNGSGADITAGGITIANGDSALVIMSNDLTAWTVLPVEGWWVEPTVIPGTSTWIEEVNFGSEIAAFDDSGQLWVAQSCASIGSFSVSNDYVVVVGGGESGGGCAGDDVSSDPVAVVTRMDVQTGAIVDTRWFPLAAGVGATVAVAPDDSIYLRMNNNSGASVTVCGDDFSATADEIIYAL